MKKNIYIIIILLVFSIIFTYFMVEKTGRYIPRLSNFSIEVKYKNVSSEIKFRQETRILVDKKGSIYFSNNFKEEKYQLTIKEQKELFNYLIFHQARLFFDDDSMIDQSVINRLLDEGVKNEDIYYENILIAPRYEIKVEVFDKTYYKKIVKGQEKSSDWVRNLYTNLDSLVKNKEKAE